MNRSFVERIFPHPPNSRLPIYEHENTSDHAHASPPRIQLHESSQGSSSRSTSTHASLRQASLHSSTVRYDDPFLPIERASKALQSAIQEFLDAQSDGLNASLDGTGIEDDLSSVGSPTPTPSIATPSRSVAGLKTIPIRQPKQRKISLRGARKGLTKSMEEFIKLKGEELRVINRESDQRSNAIDRSKVFENKKLSLISEAELLRQNEVSNDAAKLRVEADKVDREIRELEEKLFEMRARSRQLVSQANQLESSVESKLSSYNASIALVEKDIKQFLKRLPVAGSVLGPDGSGVTRGGIYALRPERRTLEMAQEQWGAELEMLSLRKEAAEDEQKALQEGVEVWQKATERIRKFEKELRRSLTESQKASLIDESGEGIKIDDHIALNTALISKLSELIKSLEADLMQAESNSWNLLVCCLGAELEALEQGRQMLQGLSGQPEDGEPDVMSITRVQTEDGNPPKDLLQDPPDMNGSLLRTSSIGSNQSLKDTLAEFEDQPKGKSLADGSNSRHTEQKAVEPTSESEDENPVPDFFLSKQ